MKIKRQNYYRYLRFLRNSIYTVQLFPDYENGVFGKYFYNFNNDKIYNLFTREDGCLIEYFVYIYKKV